MDVIGTKLMSPVILGRQRFCQGLHISLEGTDLVLSVPPKESSPFTELELVVGS